jgi:predicted DNA-binding protein YlxM (UPF0122 family)
MDYTRLNTDELTFIESYYHQNLSVKEISSRLKRSRQTIYNVINVLSRGCLPLNIIKNTNKESLIVGGIE